MIDWNMITPDGRRVVAVQADAEKRPLIELRLHPTPPEPLPVLGFRGPIDTGQDAEAHVAYLDIEAADVLIEALSIGIHEAGRYAGPDAGEAGGSQ